MVLEIVIFEKVNGCIHKRMQGRRLKYLDPISSPCEDIGELKYRPQKSTFNASDREFCSNLGHRRHRKKHVCDFLMRSQSYKAKKKRCQRKFSSFNDDRELLSVTRVLGGIEKVCLLTKSFAAAYLTFFSVAAATATDSLIT